MLNQNPVAKLKAAQLGAKAELQARIKAAQAALASKIQVAAKNPLSAKSNKFREHFFGQVKNHYELLGTELDAWGKDLTEKTAVSWHGVAIDDIRTFGGKVQTPVMKFSRDRVRRYWGIIHPDNGANLAATFTQSMTAQEIQNLRSAFVDAYRQRTLEGWDANTFHKEVQSRWDTLAGNLAGSRFVDSRGRPWKNATYLSMLARTTTARVARDSYFDTLIENGDDLARIGPSGDSCPICAAWLGLIISISGADKRFPSYADALAAGMFHPNCDCLCQRIDETVHAADIDRQAKTANVNWADPDAVAKYKAGFMADPAAPATSTLANIQAKAGMAKQAAAAKQIVDAAAQSVADPAIQAALLLAKKKAAQSWKWKATHQANLRDKLQSLELQAAGAQTKLEAAQGRLSGLGAGAGDDAVQAAKKAALEAQKQAAAIKKAQQDLLTLIKAKEQAGKLAEIEQAASQAKLKALEGEKAKQAAAMKAAKAASEKTRVQQILEAEDPDSLGQAGAAEFGKMLKLVPKASKGGVVGGSQGSFVTVDPTGQHWVTKLYEGNEDRVRTEWVANRLYAANGVRVPAGRLAVYDGKLAYCSKVDDTVRDCLEANADWAAGQLQLRKGFVTDAWVANWDTAGQNFDNIMLTPNKASSILRIDHGGALKWRAMGSKKPTGVFGPVVQELETLRNPTINPQTTRLFAKVTEDDIRKGVVYLNQNITRARLNGIIKASGWSAEEAAEIERTLWARKQFLAKRYLGSGKQAAQAAEEVVAGVTQSPPVVGAVSDAELAQIKSARQNGFSIRLDGDDIEHHDVLLWHEVNAKNQPVTGAVFKVRGEAAKRLAASVNANGGAAGSASAAQVDFASLNSDCLTAIRGISVRSTTGLEQKDFARVVKLRLDYAARKKEIGGLLNDGLVARKDLVDFEKHFEPWLDAMEKALAGKNAGATTVFTKPGLFSNLGPISRITPKTAGAAKNLNGLSVDQMRFRSDKTYTGRDLKNGFAAENKSELKGPQWGREFPYLETELPDGTRIRYWPDEGVAGVRPAAYAIRGQVQIMVQGQDAASAEKVREIMARLGVRTERTTAAQVEEHYLTQIANIRCNTESRFEAYLKALEAAGSDPSARVAAAKKALVKELGVDVTKAKGYNPQGELQHFGQGRAFKFRADLEGAEWDEFEKKYRVWHGFWGGDPAGNIDRIMNSGGQMACTTEKLRRGICPSGQSPEADMLTGGAESFFTRIRGVGLRSGDNNGVVWKSRQLLRTDVISYKSDEYGKTINGSKWIRERRAKTVADMKKYADTSSDNESCFRKGISLFDDLDYIKVANDSRRAEVLAVLKKHGWTDKWIDGRPIGDIVRVK